MKVDQGGLGFSSREQIVAPYWRFDQHGAVGVYHARLAVRTPRPRARVRMHDIYRAQETSVSDHRPPAGWMVNGREGGQELEKEAHRSCSPAHERQPAPAPACCDTRL